ncbi:MAG: PspA/IM30 family protein [Deltaproteobacteria bacterium]|nr:MAG: PspA/IM30 family protein [Deltaproteobacteria bacterium]
MSFFKRLIRVIKANLNSLISRAEEPEKILDQVLEEMQEQLQEAQSRVAHAIADEKKLKKQYQEEARQGDTWEKRAMQAVESGDDELAKKALARKAEHDRMADEFFQQWEHQKNAVEQLKNALHLLRQKIEEASRKKNLLIARKKRAEAQQMIQETISGVTENSAFDTLDRMTKKIDELEAHAEAHAELNRELKDDSLEAQFQKLEDQNNTQDDALAALKAKMGVPSKVREKEKEREAVAVPRDENW